MFTNWQNLYILFSSIEIQLKTFYTVDITYSIFFYLPKVKIHLNIIFKRTTNRILNNNTQVTRSLKVNYTKLVSFDCKRKNTYHKVL